MDEKSLGFGVSLCVPPFCAGMSTISGGRGNFGATNINSNYASVTRSGISGGAIVITDAAEQQKRTGQTADQTVASLNRDVSSDRDGSNALKPIFDEDEIRAGFEIVSAFSNEASTFLANKAREADLKREQAKALQEKADQINGNNDAAQMALQTQARQLLGEANDISENWGAGGTYRQITTALIGAAGGNISAGNAAFVQGLVVNYVQQKGASYIGDLVADGELTEGSPLHAALHGIVACAGAAASSQSCGSGAAGAAASSLLTGLFSQSSPDESEEQREAKRNLIVSLVTGLAATSASIDPTAANTAAGAAVDNNWLATQQIVQFKKEYDEAKGFGETSKVFAKWAYISSKQDVLTQFGIGKGLAQSGWNDVTGLAEFVAHPIEGLKGLKELVNNPAAREQFGETLIKELNVKIDRVTVALEKGGDENAVLLGQSIGEIAWQVGSIATGVGGAATGGVALAKAGIKVGGAQLEKMAELARIERVAANNAKNLNPMSAMTDSEAAVLIDRNVLEAGAKATAGASVDGAGGIVVAPKTIPYEPKGSVVLQGDAPVCGPACAAMTITDKTGAAISLDNAIGSFVNGVRPTGVNTLELSDVISKAGVKNTVNTTMLPEQLNKALQEGASVIVQVPAGQGKHFIIVDSVKSIDGVSYYMTRDPYVGPRGVQQGLLDGAISTGVNAIVIGK